MIVQVRIAERQAHDPLRHQFADAVLDQLRVAVISELLVRAELEL
jgi:hypothetical protein